MADGGEAGVNVGAALELSVTETSNAVVTTVLLTIRRIRAMIIFTFSESIAEGGTPDLTFLVKWSSSYPLPLPILAVSSSSYVAAPA